MDTPVCIYVSFFQDEYMLYILNLKYFNTQYSNKLNSIHILTPYIYIFSCTSSNINPMIINHTKNSSHLFELCINHNWDRKRERRRY